MFLPADPPTEAEFDYPARPRGRFEFGIGHGIASGCGLMAAVPIAVLIVNVYGVFDFTNHWIAWSLFFVLEAIVLVVIGIIALVLALSN